MVMRGTGKSHLGKNQAAISSTPTKPVAEVECLRYGVRYSSTLEPVSEGWLGGVRRWEGMRVQWSQPRWIRRGEPNLISDWTIQVPASVTSGLQWVLQTRHNVRRLKAVASSLNSA